MTLVLATNSTTVIASTALVLAGCAVGILLGRWTAPREPAPTKDESSVAQIDFAPLVAEIRRSNDLLQSKVEREAPAGAPAPSSREPGTATTDNSDRIAQAIERLSAALEHTGGGVRTVSLPIESQKGPGYASLDAMCDRAVALAQLKAPDSWRAARTEFCQVHTGWTREDLVAHYGAPDTFSFTDKGGTLGYRRGINDDRVEIAFIIQDGRVAYVSLQP